MWLIILIEFQILNHPCILWDKFYLILICIIPFKSVFIFELFLLYITGFNMPLVCWGGFFFLILTWGHFFFFSLLLEGKERREEHPWDREKSIGCLLYIPRLVIICTWTRDWTHNQDMCPDQESNPQLFGYRMIL